MVQKKRLGEIALLQRGLTYNKGDEVPSSSKVVLRSNNIDLDSHSLDLSELKYLREDFVIPEDRKVKKDSIFICMSNGSKQHVGKVAYIDRDMDYAFGGFMGLIVPKPSISSKYVFYACNSSSYRTFLSQIGNGIGIANLRFSDLEQFEVPVPSIEEQQRIVAELDLLTGIIDKKNAQLRDLDALAQSIFYEMFGDPITNEKGWPVRFLEEIASSQIGLTYKPDNVSETGTIVLRSSNIQNSIIDLNDIVRVNCDIKEKQFVREGDILMCSRNGSFRLVGKVAKIQNLPERMSYGAFMTTIRSDYNDYLFGFFKTPAFRAQLGLAKTATINQITVKMLNAIQLPVPPKVIQSSFAERIAHITSQQNAIIESLNGIQHLFNSRMSLYFG